MSLLGLIDELIPCILKAGKKIMEIYNSDLSIKLKGDGSPVTQADKASEEVILAELKKLAPDILVISEENTLSHYKIATRKYFLVDPLDGTKEFLKKDGKGSFTVNIGLIENNIPKMGIVYAPALKQLFFGCKNFGAWKITHGKKSRISVRDFKKNNITAVASASHRDTETDSWLKEHNVTKTKSIGSSLKFCLIASGQADVYPRFGPTMEWDTAAGDAILRAAGGSVTNPDLSIFNYGKDLYKNGPFIAWGGYDIN